MFIFLKTEFGRHGRHVGVVVPGYLFGTDSLFVLHVLRDLVNQVSVFLRDLK